ncbi:hypothetical protein DRQ07_12040 [candidate division KSB1 bacterium]|nr:MAG: hypothetical protein DRQ07_12040 [candidate division KSB1 bacterium]
MAKKSKKTQTNKTGKLLFLLIFTAIILLFSLGKRGFIQHIKLRLEQKRLKKEIEALKLQKEDLEKEKELLNKPEYIEKIAREEYKMAKKGEKIYIIVPDKKKK